MERLISQARKGDPDAFTALMESQMQNMYKAARSVLCNDEDIADAISDTILVCWEKFSQLKEDRYFRTWMTRILLNKCTDILRKRKQMVWMDEIPETPDVDAGFENSEWKEALNSLSENFRLVVMLYYIEGFKTSEISQILDIPEGTVRSRLARGREQSVGQETESTRTQTRKRCRQESIYMNNDRILRTLQQDVEIPEVVRKKADQAFARIHAEQEKTEPDNRKVVSYNKKETERKAISKRKIAVVAAVAALATATVTAGAAAYMKWSTGMAEGMQATETQQKQLEDNGMAAFTSQSCTDAGVTVTAEQSITDNYNSHISFKVEGFQVEDGQQPDFGSISVLVDGKDDLNLDAGFYDGIITGEDGMPVRASDGSSALDENGDMIYYYVQEDGSMEFDINMNNYSEKGFFIGKDIQVELKDLGTVDKAEFTKTLEGAWNFEWTLGGADTAKTYTLNQPLGDSGATIQTVEISPISVYAEYNFPIQKETITGENEDGTTSESTTFKEAPPLMGIKLKDGTVIKNMYMGGGMIGYQNNSSDDYVYAYATDRIIDPDQIAYFLFINDDAPIGEQGMTEDNFYEVAVGENQQGNR